MTEPTRDVLVWDLPTRLFHWATVLLVIAAYFTWRLNWMDWHIRAGYGLLALVLFRILWGFLGSSNARFLNFLEVPKTAAWHLLRSLRREVDQYAGHNPAGGWMVLLLLALLLGETLTGLYVANDVANEGPLTEWVSAPVADAITSLHAILWEALLVAVVLHIAAVVAYVAIKGQNLLLPMISGWKVLPASVLPPRLTGRARAVILFGCSALATAILARFL
jgi:cytochrome b